LVQSVYHRDNQLPEVEAVINSRPLVYVEDDINSSVTLSPMDFLSLHTQNVIPDLTDENDPEVSFARKGSAEQLLQIWKSGQKHLNQFGRYGKMNIYPIYGKAI